MKALLTRFESGDAGTFGRLTFDGFSEKFYTGELPWRENLPNVSCIPAGAYRCVLSYSARFRRPLYLVAPVLGRAGIRIHPANFQSQLNGCVALGERVGWIEGHKAVLLSRPAVRRFMALAAGRPFNLEVIDA